MPSTRIDDRDSAVVYSNVGREWSSQSSGTESYDQTLTFTRIAGATATLTFNGTSVEVYGTISYSGAGSAPFSSYTIDGGTPQYYNGVMTSNLQSQVQFYASPQLSSGQHTLVVTSLTDGANFILDSFLITPVSSATTVAAAQNSPTTTAPVSTSDAGGQASTAVRTLLITSKVVVGSSTFTSILTETTSGSIASHFSTTSGLATPSPGLGISSGDSSSPSTAASKTSLGPIVGGVMGGIVLLTIINALIFSFRRRNRTRQGDGVHRRWSNLSNAIMGKIAPLASPPGPSSGITPFSPPPYVPPPNISQSNGVEPVAHSYGRSNKQLIASGHPRAAFSADPPPAQVTGKRQVTAPDDHLASVAELPDTHQREEERLGVNAIPSSGTAGTSNGSSSNTDVYQLHPANYLEDSPPAYQTGTPRDVERILVELWNARQQ